MNVYIYLDESGNIHKNSSTQYFAIGGFLVCEQYKEKILKKYKKVNLKIKTAKKLNKDFELKGSNMEVEDKIKFFNAIQDIDTFCGIGIVFDKAKMYKEISDANVFFNYGVKILIDDIIFPLFDMSNSSEPIKFVIKIDNRNISVGNLKDLEKYLNTHFILENCEFCVSYSDSKMSYGIQLADLIVNTVYMRKKNRSSVIEVLKIWKKENFSLTQFPGKIHNGRIDKIIWLIQIKVIIYVYRDKTWV